MTAYAFLLAWIAVRLTARNDRQVPSTRRAIRKENKYFYLFFFFF